MNQYFCTYRVVGRNFPIGLSLYYSGLRGCTSFTQYAWDTYIPKLKIAVWNLMISHHVLVQINFLWMESKIGWAHLLPIFKIWGFLRLFEAITVIFDLKQISSTKVDQFFIVKPSIGLLRSYLVNGDFLKITFGLWGHKGYRGYYERKSKYISPSISHTQANILKLTLYW